MIKNFAFCGPIGSGKTTISKAFATRISTRWSSFGDIIRQIAQERGESLERAFLQSLGERLVKENILELCQRTIRRSSVRPYAGVVIDGLRHEAALSTLQSLLLPQKLYCVYVFLDPKLRRERLEQDERGSYQQLMKWEQHSTEVEVRHKLRLRSDLVIDNCGTVDESISQLLHGIEMFPTD